MASDGESQVFRLVSREGPSYTVKKAAVPQLQLVQNIIEDLAPEENEVIIPTPNVDSKTLEKIVRWCNEHAPVEEIDLEVIMRWEEEFIGELTLDELYDLLEASNYLAANALLHRLCGRVADMIRGKTPDEIRAAFGIKNDFSEVQQAEIDRNNSWAWTTHDVEPISEPEAARVIADETSQVEDETSGDEGRLVDEDEMEDEDDEGEQGIAEQNI